MHQDARYEGISESRTEVKSFVQQVARYAQKNTLKNHRTLFRTEGKSFVQQDARDDMRKTRRCANVKQCKLKVWGVAVVDLWLFFEYHAEVKVVEIIPFKMPREVI